MCDVVMAGDGDRGGGEHVRVLVAHASRARAASPSRAQGCPRLSHRLVVIIELH